MLRKRANRARNLRRSLAAFLALAMLSTAGFSALAFAVDADKASGAGFVKAEESYDDPITEEVPVVGVEPESEPEPEQPVADDATDEDLTSGESADEIDADCNPAEEIAVNEEDPDDAKDESLGISAGDIVAIRMGGDYVGFSTFAAAMNAARSGDTLYLLDDLVTSEVLMIVEDVTLNFDGFNLTAAGVVVAPGVSLTIVGGGGTLFSSVVVGGGARFTTSANIVSPGTGVAAMQSATVRVNASITAQDAGVVGMGADIVVSGNISAGRYGVWLVDGSNAVTVTGNVNAASRVVYIEGGGTNSVRISGSATGAGEFIHIAGEVLTENDYDETSSLAGYDQYSRGNAIVWIRGLADGGNDQGGPQQGGGDSNIGDDGIVDDGELDATVSGSGQSADDAAERPATGPETGDMASWSAQLAIIAAMISAIAAASLYRTREQS